MIPDCVGSGAGGAVGFWMLALSLMVISTVRMSPTLLARWSKKKARAPDRHSELAEAGCGTPSRAEARVMTWFSPTSAEG